MSVTILHDATVLTINKKREILNNYSIVVEEEYIIDIIPSSEVQEKYRNAKIVNCSNKLLMPGLIDVHAHGGISLFRNVIKDTSQWMTSLTNTLNHFVDDEFWLVESTLSALRRVSFGVTTGVTILGTNPRCDKFSFAKNQTDGYAKVGVRNYLSVGPNSTPWPDKLGYYENDKYIVRNVTYEEAIESLENIAKHLHGANNGMTSILLTPRQIVTSILSGTEGDMLTALTEQDLKNSKNIRRIAREQGIRIHTDAFRGMIKLADQDPNALLGPDVHIQHNFGISLDEVEILKRTKTKASFTPTFAQFSLNTPVIEMMYSGIDVAITSDGESYHSDFDMFGKMLLTQQMIRAIYKERNYLPNEKIIEMMTIDAAKCLGAEKEIGSIEIGKKADILTINIDSLNFAPAYDIPNLIVRNVKSENIINVMINGKILIRNRQFIYVDEKEVIKDANEKSHQIIERANLQKFAYPQKYFWNDIKAYYDGPRYDE